MCDSHACLGPVCRALCLSVPRRSGLLFQAVVTRFRGSRFLEVVPF